MRQVSGFQNKVNVPFTRNGTLQSINLKFVPGIDPAEAVTAKFVTIEINTPGSLPAPFGFRFWLNPTNVFPGGDSDFWRSDTQPGNHKTLTLPIVSGFGQPLVQAAATSAEVDMSFSILALWGGDGVVREFVGHDDGPGQESKIKAIPGWVQGDNDWREADLTAFVQPEHQGNVEAFLVMSWHILGTGQDMAGARPVGSTHDFEPPPSSLGRIVPYCVKCTSGHVIEIREVSAGKNGETHSGWVYLMGYVLSGKFDDGTGEVYQFHGNEEWTDLNLGQATWTTSDVKPYTSENVSGVMWKHHENDGTVPATGLAYYAREVGSTNVLGLMRKRGFGDYPLNTPGGEVEQFALGTGDWPQYITNWLEHIPPPPDPCDWFDVASGESWQAGAGGADWATPAAAGDWKDDKAEPDWKDDKAAGGWFDPQECD